MTKILSKISIAIFIFVVAFLASNKIVRASEGPIDLVNTVGGPSHCSAYSGLLSDLNYNILVRCRDLIYPVSSDLLTYIAWANPVTGGNPIKLGELGLGRALFKTKTPFNQIYITQERDKKTKSPTGTVVMRGNVGRDEFLDGPASTTTQQPADVSSTPLPTPNTPENSSLISRVKGGAILLVISVIVIIVMLVLVKPFK